MKQKRYVAYSLLLFLLMLVAACDEASQTAENRRDASGQPDDLLIVVDSSVWKGSIGIELQALFAKPMLGLPQDEPHYNIHKINPLKFNSVLKSVHNIIIVLTLDKNSRQTKEIKRMFTPESFKKIENDSTFFMALAPNKFVNNQKVLYLFGKNEATLAQHIVNNQKQIFEIFNQHTLALLKEKIYKKREEGLEKKIVEEYGFELQIPYGYKLAQKLPDFIWLRNIDVKHATEKSLFVFRKSFESQEEFKNTSQIRDEITKQYMRDSQKPDLYIQRQIGSAKDPIKVLTEAINFNGNYAIESKGLWAISNLTHGGPYLSYTLADEKDQKLYYIEGYVYHAAGKKKNLMREMAVILSTFKLPTQIKDNGEN